MAAAVAAEAKVALITAGGEKAKKAPPERFFTHSERIVELMKLFESEYPALCERVQKMQTDIWPTALADACKHESAALEKVLEEHVVIYLKEVHAIDREVFALTKAVRSVLQRCLSFLQLTNDHYEYLRDMGAPSNLIKRQISVMQASCIPPLQSLFDLAKELRAKSLKRLGECQKSFNKSLQPVYEKLRITLSWADYSRDVLGFFVYFDRTLLRRIPPPLDKFPEIKKSRPIIPMKKDAERLAALSIPLTELVNKFKTNKPD